MSFLKPKTKCGFVLLFSLLVSSILLATGLGISRLMIRQINLATLSRDSQVAFFAADSGLECALHWNALGKFDLATPTAARTIYCNGVTIMHGNSNGGMPGVTLASCPADPMGSPAINNIDGEPRSCFTFTLGSNPNAAAITLSSQPCTFVVVDKSDPTGITTKITSNGYNHCDINAPNVLQRTLEITLINQ